MVDCWPNASPEQQQIDIIASLSETKRKGESYENNNKYVLFWSDVNKGKNNQWSCLCIN